MRWPLHPPPVPLPVFQRLSLATHQIRLLHQSPTRLDRQARDIRWREQPRANRRTWSLPSLNRPGIPGGSTRRPELSQFKLRAMAPTHIRFGRISPFRLRSGVPLAYQSPATRHGFKPERRSARLDESLAPLVGPSPMDLVGGQWTPLRDIAWVGRHQEAAQGVW